MNRKQFVKTCGWTCLGISTGLYAGCTSIKMMHAAIEHDDMVILRSKFQTPQSGELRKFIILENDLLKYPIYLSRINDQEYTAVWMQCTHQGTELSAYGEVLQCPAHGSAFNTKGHLINGPAEQNLRSFPVRVDGDWIKISLKAV